MRTRVASNLSPWLAHTEVGDVHITPISHGEGRFIVSLEQFAALAARGQIATQYVDEDGNPTKAVPHNPNGSAFAVEGISSPDGRVLAVWRTPSATTRACMSMCRARGTMACSPAP